jgi:threonine dehydratase
MLSAAQNENTAFGHSNMFVPTEDITSSAAEIITIEKVRQAATRIAPYIKRTPTLIDTYLSSRFGSNVYLKHEVLQRTAAFKVRGAFNKMLTLSDAEKKRGVVAVSAGNHAQAVAYAAKILCLKALILMPDNTPENYIAKTKAYGARVKLYPTISDAFDAAREYEHAGSVFVHPFDDRDVIAGQGSIGLEILEDVPYLTDIIVSIGGGGLAGGVAAAVKSINPNVRIWGADP